MNTTNLRNSCRICLKVGELNVFKHEVKLSKMQTTTTLTCIAGMHEKVNNVNEDNSQEKEEERETISLKAIMESFGRLECLEMQLICESCLRELLPCYLYYRKLMQANKRIKQIYAEALKIEQQQQQQQQQQLSDIETSITSSQEELVTISSTNSTRSTPPSSPIRSTAVNKSKPQRKPKFILTGSVSKMLTNIKNDSQGALITPTKRVSSNTAQICDMQKRARTQEAPDDNSNVVVGMPLKNALLHDKTTTTAKANNNNKLRDMDFKVVEVQEEETYNWNATVDEDDVTASVYACKYCPQAFAMPEYLAAHMRKWHECKLCTRVFSKMHELHEHIRNSHQQHVCAICNKELSSHSNLRGHMKRVHGLKLATDVAPLDYWADVEILNK